MKYILFGAVFIFGSFFVAQKLFAANTDVVINEIGAYATSTHEWIEVWNKGSSGIDMSSWKFWENNTNHSLKAVTTTDSIISPGEFAVICQDGDVFLRDFPNFIGSVLDSSWTSLSESGEEVGLKDETGNFVEKFTYLATNHFSLERKDPTLNDYTSANWQENLSGNTVGAQNSNFIVLNPNSPVSTTTPTTTEGVPTTTESTPTTTTSTVPQSSTSTPSATSTVFDWAFIKLNEIVSDPVEGNEKVEIYNSGSSTAEISQASLCDSTGTSCKLFSGTVLGHDWLVVDLLTDRYLNNDGDAVVLKNEENNIVDQVTYGTDGVEAPAKGQALIRSIDGVNNNTDSDWSITTDVTLGAANHLSAPVVDVTNGSGNSGSVNNTLSSTNNLTSSTAKTIKTTTTTIKSVVDPIKISWKLDWPYGLDINEPGIFSAQGTADPRGGQIDLVWNFGDKTTSTGFIVYHSFASSGIYLVSVTGASTASTTGVKEFKIYVGPEFSTNHTQLKIGNYLAHATSTDDEFIEIINFSTTSRNISGWKIKNKSGKEYEIPENTNIAVSGTLKFFRSITHLSFDKDGDEIIFTSPNDKEIDKVILLSANIIKKEIEKNVTKTVKSVSSANWRVVQGAVTALPGIFGTQYFYISDGEKGYQVYQYKKDFPDLEVGDKVVVRGEMSVISGVERIKTSSRNNITVLGKDHDFVPLSLEDLDEAVVGTLVKIVGDITSMKSNYMYIDDGNSENIIYFRTGANIDKSKLKLGDKLEVAGILEQTKSGLRVSPRDNNDIQVVGFSEQILSQQTGATAPMVDDVQEKYLTATAGGVTTLILGFLARSRGAIVVTGAKKVVSIASKIINRG